MVWISSDCEGWREARRIVEGRHLRTGLLVLLDAVVD
jgi:hypothetical protein